MTAIINALSLVIIKKYYHINCNRSYYNKKWHNEQTNWLKYCVLMILYMLELIEHGVCVCVCIKERCIYNTFDKQLANI